MIAAYADMKTRYKLEHIVIFTSMALASACASPPQRSTDGQSIPEAQAADEAQAKALAQESSFFTEVLFQQGSAVLDDTAKANINDLIDKATHGGTGMQPREISEFRVVSWSDDEYPSDSLLSPTDAQKELADNRDDAVKDYIQERFPSPPVALYNMVQDPNALQAALNNRPRNHRSPYEQPQEQGGIVTDAIEMKSRALVIAVIKKP